jgi:glycosyltransferase involved in cell wall biosynthesis
MTPQRINLVGYLDTFSSYGLHLIHIAGELQKLGHFVTIRPLRTRAIQGAGIPLAVRTMVVSRPQPEDLEIVIAPPDAPHTPGKRTLHWCAWETTRLPKSHVANLNTAWAVCVPSQWNARACVASGVTVPVQVVPLGIDPGVFDQHKVRARSHLKVGCAGRSGHGVLRKGVAVASRLFREAFWNEPRAILEIKTQPDDNGWFPADSRIKVIRESWTDSQVASWLHGLNGFISAATGEGWGLWQHQAVATGTRLITTRYGGVCEFLPDDGTYCDPVREIPAAGWGDGEWCLPNYPEMIDKLRELVGLPLAGPVHGGEFTWSRSAMELTAFVSSEAYEVRVPTPRLFQSFPKMIIRHDARPPEDIIVEHYKNAIVRPRPSGVGKFIDHDLKTSAKGVGDFVIMTGIPSAALSRTGRSISIKQDAWPCQSLSHIVPCLSEPTHEKWVDCETIQEQYDCGNGHYIQRIHRGLGLEIDHRPAGRLSWFVSSRKWSKVALHFDTPGPSAQWQEQHIHPAARTMSPQAKAAVVEFINSQTDCEFIEVGTKRCGWLPETCRHLTGCGLDSLVMTLDSCDYFIGIVSGPMHVAAALELKMIILPNFPDASVLILPALKPVSIVDIRWLYPQAVHLHQESGGPLAPLLTADNLKRAMDGEVYPHWNDDKYLHLIDE